MEQHCHLQVAQIMTRNRTNSGALPVLNTLLLCVNCWLKFWRAHFLSSTRKMSYKAATPTELTHPYLCEAAFRTGQDRAQLVVPIHVSFNLKKQNSQRCKHWSQKSIDLSCKNSTQSYFVFSYVASGSTVRHWHSNLTRILRLFAAVTTKPAPCRRLNYTTT